MLEEQYKYHLSNFFTWDQLHHAEDYVLFKRNISSHISIDETCLSRGEVYTIVSSKSAHGGRGSLIAMIKGTAAEQVVPVLQKISYGKRSQVKEITLDLSPSMKLIAKLCFPAAVQVSDRFHVQKLMCEAMDDLRRKHRWEVIDQENAEIQLAKEVGRKYKPDVLRNKDTLRQLMARSRHLLFKHKSKWNRQQSERAEILFERYPDIEMAYNRYLELIEIYNKNTVKEIAAGKLAHWYNRVEKMGIPHFRTVIETIQNNYLYVLNYFEKRSTNASAESFNAKIKAFRAQFRGVRDTAFFIFRLTKIYA